MTRMPPAALVLSATEWTIMHVLWRHESILVAGIVQELGGALETQAVTIYLRRLRKRRLVGSHPDPERLNRDLWRAEVTIEEMVAQETEIFLSRTLRDDPRALRVVLERVQAHLGEGGA